MEHVGRKTCSRVRKHERGQLFAYLHFGVATAGVVIASHPKIKSDNALGFGGFGIAVGVGGGVVAARAAVGVALAEVELNRHFAERKLIAEDA